MGKKFKHIAVTEVTWRKFKAFKAIMQYLSEMGLTISSDNAIIFMIHCGMEQLERRIAKYLKEAQIHQRDRNNKSRHKPFQKPM